MKNIDIRLLVDEKGLKYKDIAKVLHITPEWLSRVLRDELSEERRYWILQAIEEMTKGDREE